MLARRYELTLRDQNAERRKYGRYGPPGTKRMKIETQNGGATDGVPLPAPAAQGSVAQPPLVTGRPVLLIEAGTPPSGVAVLPPPAPVAVLSPVATNAPPVAVPAPAAP